MTDNIDLLAAESAQSRAHYNTGQTGVAATPTPFLMPWFRPKSDLDLPRWGYAGRDPLLGRVWKMMGADIVASAIAAMTQKVESTDYLIDGPQRTVNSVCRPLLDNAELGQGWMTFLAKWVQAYCVYDNGVMVELISDAPPLRYYDEQSQRFMDGEAVPDLSAPREGPVRGLAVMDSTRCARTRDVEFPIRYYDLQGRVHLMHRSRIYFTSDLPSTEEIMFDYGFCALSRCLATLHYGVNWATARNEMLDAMPALQYLAISGINKDEFIKQAKEYEAQRKAYGEYILRSVLMLVSPNSDKPISFQAENIRQLWESFDEQKAFNVCIDMVAMAFGLDHQDLAPLSTSAMGSGAQSQVLNDKTKGKGPGHIRAKIEQMMKSVFPASCRFAFDDHDGAQDMERITIINGKVDAVLKLFNAKQGASPASTGMPFFSKAAAEPAPAQDGPISPPAPAQQPDPAIGAPVAPPDEFLLSREQALQLLMKEVPDWADILDPGDTISQDETVDELTPDLQTKQRQLYGPLVRYHAKSGKVLMVKAKPGKHSNPVSTREIAQAAHDLALMGIDLSSVREYATKSTNEPYDFDWHEKEFASDEQRRAFFGHLSSNTLNESSGGGSDWPARSPRSGGGGVISHGESIGTFTGKPRSQAPSAISNKEEADALYRFNHPKADAGGFRPHRDLSAIEHLNTTRANDALISYAKEYADMNGPGNFGEEEDVIGALTILGKRRNIPKVRRALDEIGKHNTRAGRYARRLADEWNTD